MPETQPTHFGEYQVIRRIGKGGFGSVYLAENKLFPNHQFAIKVFHTPENSPDQIAPLQNELKNLANLSHTHIVQLRGFGVDQQDGNSVPYIVMDFIEGPNGSSYNLKQHLQLSGGRLSPEEVKKIFSQILSALSLVHESLVAHLDLKPENILLDKKLNAYLTDFGISKTVPTESIRLGMAPNIQGYSPIYASPEQVQHGWGSRHSDIFSLGVILLECLTGKRPDVIHSKVRPKVEYSPPSAEGLDTKWDVLMERCLSVDPAYRFPNAGVFLRMLQQIPTGDHEASPLQIHHDPTPVEILPPPGTPMTGNQPRLEKRSPSSPTVNQPSLPTTAISTLEVNTPSAPPLGSLRSLLDKTAEGESRPHPKSASSPPIVPAVPWNKILGLTLGLIGCLLGLWVGWMVGESIGLHYANDIAVQISGYLGITVGPWIGRDVGRVLGMIITAAAIGVLGLLFGWVIGSFMVIRSELKQTTSER